MRKQSNRWLSIWKLHLDVNLVWLLIYVVVVVRGDGPLNRDVCSYLGERYWRLADLYHGLGKLERSKMLRHEADLFLRHGDWGGDDPPPAAALAMPIPEPPIFTNAIGFRLGVKRGTT